MIAKLQLTTANARTAAAAAAYEGGTARDKPSSSQHSKSKRQHPPPPQHPPTPSQQHQQQPQAEHRGSKSVGRPLPPLPAGERKSSADSATSTSTATLSPQERTSRYSGTAALWSRTAGRESVRASQQAEVTALSQLLPQTAACTAGTEYSTEVLFSHVCQHGQHTRMYSSDDTLSTLATAGQGSSM